MYESLFHRIARTILHPCRQRTASFSRHEVDLQRAPAQAAPRIGQPSVPEPDRTGTGQSARIGQSTVPGAVSACLPSVDLPPGSPCHNMPLSQPSSAREIQPASKEHTPAASGKRSFVDGSVTRSGRHIKFTEKARLYADSLS
eukprot:scpid19654/ scgid13273/ 